MSKALPVNLKSFIKSRRFSVTACLCFALILRPDAVIPAAAQLLPPAFDPAGSIAPAGSILPGQVLLDVSSGVYTFTYSENAVPLTQYRIDANNNGVKTGLLKIRETLTNSYPIAYGGTQYRRLNGSVLQPFQLANTAAVQFQHSRIGDFARFDYSDTVDGKTTRKIYDVTLRGKTLVVHAYAVDPGTSPFGNYSGFIFDRTEQTPNAKAVVIPYMELVPVMKAGANEEFFYSVYLDYSRSHSNVYPVRAPASAFSITSYYNSFNSSYTAAAPLYPAFDETVYVTVSPYVQDLMMKIHRSQSPYRAALNNRVIADIWAPNFDNVRNNFIAKFRDFGMDNLAVINHNWQNMGYDCGLPSHYPANQGRGGDAAMKTLADYALNSGYLFALHQNYAGMNQNSPYWTSADISVSTDGTQSKAWNIPASCPLSPQAYWIAADKMVKYSDLEAPSIKSGYQTNASYLDVTPTMSPAQLIDYSVSNLKSFTLEDALGNVLALNERQHAVFQGPLFGEGSAGSYQILQTGSVDGVEGEIPGREAAPVIPDFVLKQVKPLRADHGMGYHGRWIGSAGQIIGLNAATFPMDKYRATQIAYGRAGFMGHSTLNGTTADGFLKYWTKEFYTFRELQSQYLSSDIQQILYRNSAGSLVDLNQALRDNVDFLNSQLKLTYANGLELYVNRHQSSTWTVTMGGATYYLPPNGWAAINASSGFLELSHLVNSAGSPDAAGHRADFVKTPAYIMADGRGVTTSFGNDFSGQVIVSSGLLVLKPENWKLKEQEDGSLLAVLPIKLGANSVVTVSTVVTSAYQASVDSLMATLGAIAPGASDRPVVIGTLADRKGVYVPQAVVNTLLAHSESFWINISTGRVDVIGSDGLAALHGLSAVESQAEENGGVFMTGAATDWPDIAERGLHMTNYGDDASGSIAKDAIRKARLVQFNRLLLRVDYRTRFDAMVGWRILPITWSKQEFADIVQFARQNGLEFVPEVKLLTHQNILLTSSFPELMFDAETYDPSKNSVYTNVVFPLLDEIIAAFSPKLVHIGHDEVNNCYTATGPMLAPELFESDTLKIYNYLKTKGVGTAMWADMLISTAEFPTMGSHSGFCGARYSWYKLKEKLPRDIRMYNWHYFEENYFPSTLSISSAGYNVAGATWEDGKNIQKFANYMANNIPSANQGGMLATYWTSKNIGLIIKASGKMFWKAGQVLNTGTAPAKISDFSISTWAYNSAAFSWTAPARANTYNLRYRKLGEWSFRYAVPAPPQAPGAPESFTLGGLSYSTTYYAYIQASDEWLNWGPQSRIIEFITPAAPPPSVSITAPLSGSVVSGTITVSAAAASVLGVRRVVFSVDGVIKATDTVTPYSYTFNTAGLANGAHTIGARVYDTLENQTFAESVVVSTNAPALILGVHNVDSQTPVAVFAQLRDAGVNLVRTNIGIWHYVQASTSVWNFSGADYVVNNARANGLEVLMELMGSPSWESARPALMFGGQNPSMPLSVPDYKAYCLRLAQRYSGRVNYYELWNEQNASGVWFKGGTARDYVDLARASYEAVKAVSPDNKLIMGGLVAPASVESFYASPAFFSDTLTLGISSFLDAYNVHYPAYRWGRYDWVKGLIAQRGDPGKPLWNSEENSHTGPGGIAKGNLVSAYLQGAPAVVHYLLRDIAGQPDGLYDSAWTPKPELAEYGQFGRFIGARHYAGARKNGVFAEFVFVSTAGAGSLDFVVWNMTAPGGLSGWQSPAGLSGCSAVDYLGAPAGGSVLGDGLFHVNISSLPVYLSCSAADRGSVLAGLNLSTGAANTLSAALRSATASLDTAVPALTVTAPAPSSVVSGTVTIQFSGSDNSGLYSHSIQIDGVLRDLKYSAHNPFLWDTRTVPNGLHSIRVAAMDADTNLTVRDLSVTVNNPLVGRHEVSNCSVSTGWVCDPDSYSRSVLLHFYLDGPAGKGTFAGWTPADLPREAAVGAQCGGGINHGFSFATPSSIKNGQPHTIYAYAINIDSAGHPSGANPLLPGSSVTVTCSGGVSGNSVISAFAGGSTITIRTTSRLAGAIGSLTWKGKEFVNAWDHGREIQSASFFNGYGQSFNPNEAGSFSDGTGPASTSLLEALSASGSTLTTRTRMAFWRRPGDLTAPYQPVMNTTPLSGHILNKTVRIGFGGIPNVIEYLTRFTVPESYSSASFEAVTGYMPAEFSDFWRYNPQTHVLTSLSDGPGGQPLPVIFSTPDKKYSMGIYSPDIPLTGSPYSGYSRYRFASADPAYATNKWNCLFRRDATPAGDYDFRCYVVVGTQQEVTASMDRLHIYFDTAAPSVSITAPAGGSAASGQLVVSASAADNYGVNKVEFFVDDVLMGTDSSAPYSFTLDTTLLTNNAPARLRATAYDASGNKADAAITVLVGNPVPPLPVNPAFRFTGAEEIVYDYSTQKCENWDFPDTPARAFRTADGKVSLISTSYKNYRLTGPSLNALGKDCHSLMPTRADPAQFNYSYHGWLTAPYTEDGINIYSLVHNEWYAYLADPKCTVARRIDGWVNSLTLAVSTNSAFSFYPPAEYLVAASSVPWSTAYPCSEGNSTRYGMFNPGNIIKKADGYYYAMYQSEPDPNGYLKKGQCLMRTRRLDQAAAWEAWTGSAWDTSPNAVCAPIQYQRIESMRESITYNSYLNSYVLFGTKHYPVAGFFFSLSKDGFNWSAPVEVFKDTNTFYPALLDPADTSLNFENSGREAYLYYTRHNGAGLARDLVRRRLQFTLPSVSISTPAADAVLLRTVAVSADAVGSFVRAALYVDGVYKSSDTVFPYQFSLNTSALADGAHTLTVSAYDGTGSTVSAQAAVFTHNAPPVISSAAAVFVSSYMAVLDWITNEPATTRVEYGTSPAYGSFTVPVLALTSSHTVTLAGLDPGTTYYWRARSVDAYGNGAITPGPDFIGMTDRLVVTLGEPASGAVLRGMAALLAYAGGGTGIQRVEFKADGVYKSSDTVPPYQYNLNTLLLADGGHTLTAWAYDNSGSSAAHSVSVSVHNIPPVISAAGVIGISSFAAVCRWDTDEPATTRVEYGTGLTYGLFSANDVTLSTGHIVRISGLSAGATYYWRVRSIDSAGNLRVSTGPAFVALPPPDTTPPVISGAAALRISSAGVVCAWRTNEPATTRVEYGPTPEYGSFTPEVVLLSTGHAVPLPGLLPDTVYYWRAISSDSSGNEAALAGPEFATAVGGDQVPPVVSILWPQPGASLTGPAEIRAAATDNRGVSRVEFYLEGISYIDYFAPYAHILRTLRLSNGTHTLTARAFDSDGNSAETSVSFEVYNERRLDKLVSSSGAVILLNIAGITIPPLAIVSSAPVSIAVVSDEMDEEPDISERSLKMGVQRITEIGSGFRILPEGYVPGSPVRIKLPAGRGTRPAAALDEVLAVYAWDTAAGAWQALPSVYNAADNTVNAETSLFSVYALFSSIPLTSVGTMGEVYVFPNPAKGGLNPVFHIETDTADKVEIQIFDLTGRQVHKQTITSAPVLVNRNGRLSSAYEYEWDVKKAGSGAYFYIVTVSAPSGKAVKKGKFAIIR